jgi:hypothetical protein
MDMRAVNTYHAHGKSGWEKKCPIFLTELAEKLTEKYSKLHTTMNTRRLLKLHKHSLILEGHNTKAETNKIMHRFYNRGYVCYTSQLSNNIKQQIS